MEPGRFITLEGGEGGGKSTQARRLADGLAALGLPVLLTREPGGAPGAEILRNLLLGGSVSWSAEAETLLHFAARTEHADKTIRPALAAGVWVVCDRFYDSTMVYQGWGLGSDRTAIGTLIGLLGLVPDLTLVLDVTVETTMARLASRGAAADRYERLGAPFFARIREGFQTVARGDPGRCAMLDGTPDEASVAAAVMAAVRARFALS